ncbi:MAG: peptidylprolyl isomerase [Phycisphaerae bacterium]|nr:peptidylprolyl isomerase [Gemmatimonadaceae bacterium]
MMWTVFVAGALSWPLAAQQEVKSVERRILEIEHARAHEQIPSLEIYGGWRIQIREVDPRVRRLTVRAIGRMERPELATMALGTFRNSTDARVRQEAANALGQLNAVVNYSELIAAEQNGVVRGELYTSAGRVTPAITGSEELLRTGLSDATAEGRTGAARGLEWLLRSTRGMKAAPATIDALKAAFRANTSEIPRQLILLALNQQAAGDSATYALALRDTSAQVRRMAVAGSRQWIADPSPMVRYQALRTANNCQRAQEALSDASGMVQLAAIDLMGDRKCEAQPLIALFNQPQGWPVRAHAVVALAKINPTPEVRLMVKELANTPAWQARVYAATAARIVGDTHIVAKLALNAEPNVVIEAMTTPADAIRALSSNHSGLLFAAATKLKGSPALAGAMPQIFAALDRVTKTGRATTRDERTALLARVGEAGDAATIEKLRPYLSDVDAAIAKQAATIISQKTGKTVEPITTKLATVPLPTQSFLDGLVGATATITMKGLGVITLELLMDEAPVTAAKFAELADKGKYDGLTFHRIVPNFVIQGGSPGADEYDGITEQFMKEEVGIPSHLRGTLGISTRGHDTGDGQIFINLIDNYRLDHQYTVFARITSGMDIVDKVLEGDVMQSVKIIRKR